MPNLDAGFVESIYRAHGHVVLRRARRILGSEDDARDVLQEIFASLIGKESPFRGDSSVTTWLYSATTNACLNRMRNHKTRSRVLEGEARQERADEAVAASNAESAAIVRQLLERVPDPLAEVAIHYYVDEMTHEEIADVLHCSRRHVGDLIERLHASLRDLEVAQ